MLRFTLFTICGLLISFNMPQLKAQAQAGRAGFGFTGGGAKLFGEFSDNSWWIGGDLFFRYNVHERFALQAQFNYANPRYRVDVENKVATYTDYFGLNEDGSTKSVGDRYPNGTLISDDSQQRRNNSRIMTFEVLASFNILPAQRFNPFVFAGLGLMNYQVRPGLSGGAGLRINPQTGQTEVGVLPGQDAGLYKTSGFNGGLVFPVGAGFELYITDDLALTGKATYRFTSTKYLDDYNPGSMKAYDANSHTYTSTLPAPPGVSNGSTDGFLTVGLGLTFYVFGNADFDEDGITNAQEERIGTDPNNPDTDGDGLPDGYEYFGTRKVPIGFERSQIDALPDTEYRTDPKKSDTDGDGLSDMQEIVLHKTNPLNVDTDADGLADNVELARKTNPLLSDSDHDGLLDGDEINVYKSDPLMADTDMDGLMDGDEVKRYATSPIDADTDKDLLTDGDEVLKYFTNPAIPDTDNDQLLDGEEVNTTKTNPTLADTDGDLLTDGEEVKVYKTNPLLPDTDADRLTDGDEVNKYKTNPSLADTDLDSLNDGDEVLIYSTDPTNKDTDGDGLSDGDEVLKYHSDPRGIDTDKDGLKDGEEVLTYFTDPIRRDTDLDSLSDGDEVHTTKTLPTNPDTDGDTFIDGLDKCPLIAGIAPDGCPPKPKPNTVSNFPGVIFLVNTDKFDMREPGTLDNLNRIKALVDQCDSLKVEIEGHASSEGNDKRNQELSDMRASAVKAWLVNQGVPVNKIVKTIGYGSTKPLIPEPKKGSADAIEAARKQNRRIAVRVVETCK